MFSEKVRVDDAGENFGVYGQAAALYVALLRNGYIEEAAEFAVWFLDTFDLDLET